MNIWDIEGRKMGVDEILGAAGLLMFLMMALVLLLNVLEDLMMGYEDEEDSFFDNDGCLDDTYEG